MKQRCLWRGIEAEVQEYKLGDAIDFQHLDLVLLGGGSDREQKIVCRQLQKIRQTMKDYVEDGGVVLAICGGYQLLGHYYETEDDKMKGLSLVDLYTKQGSPRLISNIIISNDAYSHPVTGFENHGGRTFIGENQPFGKVLYGNGNNDRKDYEGVIYKNVIGTYLHGPLLPKNPWVCDDLLQRALERRYGSVQLEALKDLEEEEANHYICDRFLTVKHKTGIMQKIRSLAIR